MSPIIVLSSSPAPMFAPSPTQVDFSSPPRLSQGGCSQKRHDKTTVHGIPQNAQESCSTKFVSAKHILEPRPCAENVPMNNVSSTKYTHVSSLQSSSTSQFDVFATDLRLKENAASVYSTGWDELPSHTVVKILPSDAKRRKKTDGFEPSRLDRATARRKDWTPTKPSSGSGFGMDLAKSFGHVQASPRYEAATNAGDGALTKRRKLGLVGSGQHSISKPNTKTENTRKKSPTKKGLTITGLAMSHYLGADKEESTPMMQYLVSTQARKDTDELPDTFETKFKTKGSRVKVRRPKSRLKSPVTAQKTAESQEFMFGTASQLARQESPTLMRDTLEAIKQSEETQFSSPIRSQYNGVFSTESSPAKHIGTFRYLGRRSLWSAAHRDTDDALLHLDGDVDASLERDTFTGKDALVEHAAAIPKLDGPDNSLALLATLNPAATLCDINDISEISSSPVPCAPKSSSVSKPRRYSTTTKRPTSEKREEIVKGSTDSKAPGIDSLKRSESRGTDDGGKPIPPKPNYATWTDEQLKDAVTARGIKRLRARKSMIAKLDEAWALQHGLDPAVVKLATKRASQTARMFQPGDILGNVHGLAARPALKVKKPRRRRAEQNTHTVSVPVRDEDNIVDISDLENSHLTILDRLANIKAFSDESESEEVIDDDDVDIPPSTAPVRGTGVKAVASPRSKDRLCQKLPRLLTPPPTVASPVHRQSLPSSPGFEELPRHPSPPFDHPPVSEIPASPDVTSPETSFTTNNYLDPPIESRIREAITHVSKDNGTRNHQVNPTWHEKILLYDPIVLEDLTAWLNTEGFNTIGEDREIDIMQVRDWCHEQGVCCLWKGGWRGNKKTGKTNKQDAEE